MKNYIFAVALVLIASSAMAQQQAKPDVLPTVSVAANNSDVKVVLHSMFEQAKKNFVIEPNIYFALNLILDNVDFDEALQIVCKSANLKYELQNGIYFISREGSAHRAAQAITEKKPEPAKHFLPKSVLEKKLTTKLSRIDIRQVYATFGEQAGVTFEVDKSVPKYKLDVYLTNTTLKYALDHIKAAAGLAYELTDHDTIRITKPTPIRNGVAIANPSKTP